jgi:4'-phosphopantetheinyl transferase
VSEAGIGSRPAFLDGRLRIDIWAAPAGAGLALLPVSYLAILDDSERQRYRRLRRESDRRRYFAAHVLLRAALSRAAGGEVDARRWRFTEDDYGRPSVAPAAGLPCLHFNLSHSEALAVVAVSSTCAVGIDVEVLRPNSASGPLDAVLAPGERAWLSRRPPAGRWIDFTRLWTLKEAYAKLVGHGLSLDPASFEVALDPVRMVRTETGAPQPDGLHLETHEIRIDDDPYQLSLAARSPSAGAPAVTLRVASWPLVDSHRDQEVAAA